MISRRSFLYAASLLLSGFALPLAAITTVEVEIVCPVCRTKNKFYDYASWGSYIYSYPSKFQLVFWPHTSSTTIYLCKQCHLSLFMWDFKDFPKGKVQDAATLLKSVKLSSESKSYTAIPASEKLLIAEKVYRLLGRDNDFWNLFYRVLGYYFAQERKPSEAAAARLHALQIARTMLGDSAHEGRKKELLVIAASMQHFTGSDPDALNSLKQAAALK